LCSPNSTWASSQLSHAQLTIMVATELQPLIFSSLMALRTPGNGWLNFRTDQRSTSVLELASVLAVLTVRTSTHQRKTIQKA
jgi:hypothetical protein